MNFEDDPLGGRAVWSDDDFEQMGWHDATIWAIAFLAPDAQETLVSTGELLLDIDYIVRWNDPVPPDEYFTFAVAPATLVFEDVWSAEAQFDVNFPERTEIDSIERGKPANDRQQAQGVRRWTIDGGLAGSFVASGFHQYFRSKPIDIGYRQHLTLEERGGISFARPIDFTS